MSKRPPRLSYVVDPNSLISEAAKAREELAFDKEIDRLKRKKANHQKGLPPNNSPSHKPRPVKP